MQNIELNADLSEKVNYNNELFPAYIRRANLSYYHDYRAACHWHTDFEFIYVYDGAMDYSVNNQIVTLSKGQGLFVNSDCLHYGFSESHSECNFLCILLHPSLLTSNSFFNESVIMPLCENTSLPFILLRPTIKWQNDIILELHHLESCKDDCDVLSIVRSFVNILHIIINNSYGQEKLNRPDADLTSLASMIGFVQQNYTDKISITALAHSGNCCKTKCNTLFRKYLNMTPLEYMTGYRLQKSTEMLTGSSATISEIAYSCGFSGASYFCETFVNTFGMSPKRYRERSRENKLEPL